MNLKDHLEKLNYFYKVSQLGSIKEASQKLHLTQPSITKSIKTLEEALEVSLFIRQARGVLLTQEGKILKKFCHSLFSQIEDIEKKIQEPDDPLAGSIKVGTYDSIAIYFWPKFLKFFMKLFPNLDIELSTDRSHMIQKKVESGELDLGLIIEPSARKELSASTLYTDSFLLYSSTKYSKLKIDFESTPLIYMPDAIAGEKQSRLTHLVSFKNKFRKEFKTSSLESAKELISSGLGIGLLPKMVAKDALREKKIAPLKLKGFPKNGVGKHNIGLIYPKQSIKSQVLRVLIDEIQQQKWK